MSERVRITGDNWTATLERLERIDPGTWRVALLRSNAAVAASERDADWPEDPFESPPERRVASGPGFVVVNPSRPLRDTPAKKNGVAMELKPTGLRVFVFADGTRISGDKLDTALNLFVAQQQSKRWLTMDELNAAVGQIATRQRYGR